jgi:YggT family protein
LAIYGAGIHLSRTAARKVKARKSPFTCSSDTEPLHVPIAFLDESAMKVLFGVIDIALGWYMVLVLAAVIVSWLVAFNVVNTRNQFVSMVGEFLYRITEPALRPIRNVLPNLGGIDISPVILFLIIIFLRGVIAEYIIPNVP